MDPLEVVEAFGSAWADHDLTAALAMVTDDCVFDATGPAPDGARHVGRDAIRRAWEPIFDDAASQFDGEETFAAGDRVIQLWRYTFTARSSGRRGAGVHGLRAGRRRRGSRQPRHRPTTIRRRR
jgi:ketosteroid isomerase-like protein